jgi:hypothetical protein
MPMKKKKHCTACNDYGFLLAQIPLGLVIERCDACNSMITDDQATEAVAALARAAMARRPRSRLRWYQRGYAMLRPASPSHTPTS